MVQAFYLGGSLQELYGSRGLMQSSLADALMPTLPFFHGFDKLFTSSDQTIRLIFTFYLGCLAALMLGWHHRFAAVGAWMSHLFMMRHGFFSGYGVDQFAHITLFYLIFIPAADLYAIGGRASERGAKVTFSRAARLSLRLLQLHLSIVYFATGLEKALGRDWWDGESIWRALNVPGFCPYPMTWISSVPWLAVVAGWLTLLVELGYVFFIWPRATRKYWITATLLLHGGIMVFLQLWSFSAVMMLLTLCAFGIRDSQCQLAECP